MLGHMVDKPEFEHIRSFSGRDADRMTEMTCHGCGNAVEMIDRRFLRFGPVRCGACGKSLNVPALARLLASTIEISSD